MKFLIPFLLATAAFAQSSQHSVTLIPSTDSTGAPLAAGELRFRDLTNPALATAHTVGFRSPTHLDTDITWTLTQSTAAGCFTSDGMLNIFIGPCGGLPVSDLTSLVYKSTDITAQVRLKATNISTLTVRNLIAQDSDYIIAGTNITNDFSTRQIFDNSAHIAIRDNSGTAVDVLSMNNLWEVNLGKQSVGDNPFQGNLNFWVVGQKAMSIVGIPNFGSGAILQPAVNDTGHIGFNPVGANTAFAGMASYHYLATSDLGVDGPGDITFQSFSHNTVAVSGRNALEVWFLTLPSTHAPSTGSFLAADNSFGGNRTDLVWTSGVAAGVNSVTATSPITAAGTAGDPIITCTQCMTLNTTQTVTGFKTFHVSPILENNIPLYSLDSTSAQVQLLFLDGTNNVEFGKYDAGGDASHGSINFWTRGSEALILDKPGSFTLNPVTDKTLFLGDSTHRLTSITTLGTTYLGDAITTAEASFCNNGLSGPYCVFMNGHDSLSSYEIRLPDSPGTANQVLGISSVSGVILTTAWVTQTAGVGGVSSVSGTSPIASTGGATPVISIQPGGPGQDGYITASAFISFNNRVQVVSASAPLSSTGGLTPNIAITQAGSGSSGYLSAGDWNIFFNRIGSVNPSGPITVATSGVNVTVGCPNCALTTGTTFSGAVSFNNSVAVSSAAVFSAGGGSCTINTGGLSCNTVSASTFSGSGTAAFLNATSTGQVLNGDYHVVSGNFYNRTFAGAPNCSGVGNGWTGYDTSSNTLWICNGGVARAH